MKEVSESTWSFQIIIYFILIFACFLILALSYNKAYVVKNRTLTIIEKYEGVTKESINIINGFMKEKAYKTIGKCDEDWYGATDLDGSYEKSDGTQDFYYCFREQKAKNNKIYYTVQVFYKFNLPILENIFNYKIEGDTKGFIGAKNRITDERK